MLEKKEVKKKKKKKEEEEKGKNKKKRGRTRLNYHKSFLEEHRNFPQSSRPRSFARLDAN